MVQVEFFGSCFPINPGGETESKYIIKKGEEIIDQKTISYPASFLNSKNVAEYKALNYALVKLMDEGLVTEKVLILSDSVLAINQLSGVWKAKGGLYFVAYKDAKILLKFFTDINFQLIEKSKD